MHGLRVIFHVSPARICGLAYKMIARKDPPYTVTGLSRAFTSLPRSSADYTDFATSYNHHFLGDISNWFRASAACSIPMRRM